jgi:DNA-binding MarR family transcriptional regulator
MKSDHLAEITDHVFSLKHLLFKAFGKTLPLKSKISPLAYFILLQLKDKQTLSMTELSRKLGIPKPNVTVLVDKLIEKKLTERINDKQDRRMVMIKLTKKGYDYMDIIRKSYDSQIKEKLLMLSEKDMKQFAGALVVVRNTLSALKTID